MRAGDEQLSGILREAFAAHLYDDPHPPANYSIRLSGSSDRHHELYWGRCSEITSPDPSRVVDALLLHLGHRLGSPQGTLPLNVLALVRDGEAVLVPRFFRDALVSGRRRLEDRGWALLDGPVAYVAPETSELVVARSIPVPQQLDDLIRSLAAPRRPDPGVPDGAYPVRRWYFIEPFEIPAGYSPATATRIAATALSMEPRTVTAEHLHRLTSLFRGTEAQGVAPDWRESMLPALQQA